MTLKAIERRTDGVLVPDAEHEPLSVVELQIQFDPTIYNRIAIEMALIQEQYNQRNVQGIIIFLTTSIDPKTPPWNKIVQVFYLTEMLEALSIRIPELPLVALFRPVLEENLETLEKKLLDTTIRSKASTLRARPKENYWTCLSIGSNNALRILGKWR